MTFEGALTSYKLVAAHFWASHRLERTIAIRQPVPWKHGNGQVAPAVGLLRVCRCRVACACTFVLFEIICITLFFFVFSVFEIALHGDTLCSESRARWCCDQGTEDSTRRQISWDLCRGGSMEFSLKLIFCSFLKEAFFERLWWKWTKHYASALLQDSHWGIS